MVNKFKIGIKLFIVATIIGCVGTAKISSFPKSYNEIDFDEYSKESNSDNPRKWTFETSDEFYFEKEYNAGEFEEAKLISAIEAAFNMERYRIYSKDILNNRIVGKRGLQADEWNSIVGIYYKFNAPKNTLQIYIKTEITQDVTGGPNKQRSASIAKLIDVMLESRG